MRISIISVKKITTPYEDEETHVLWVRLSTNNNGVRITDSFIARVSTELYPTVKEAKEALLTELKDIVNYYKN